MTGTGDQTALLDELQTQLNQVLEHTGRLFAALNTSPKERPVAQIAKLQSILPIVENRFHSALDQLEDELQLTMLVMRRDLALCRERSGQQLRNTAPTQPAAPVATQTDDEPAQKISPDTKPVQVPSPELEQTQSTDDVVMEDVKPSLSAQEPPDEKPVEPAAEMPVDTKPQMASVSDSKPAGDDSMPANPELQLDTKAADPDDQDSKPAEDEKAPDTAAETNNDLDSLFNDDAMSTGGMVNDGDEFNFDQGDGNIDFGDFGQMDANSAADNDNISSLLPGLEDYANTQTNEVDLDQLFNLGGNDDSMNTQGAGEQGDSFEDLLAGFDGETVDESQNTAGNQEFDFDSLFK